MTTTAPLKYVAGTGLQEMTTTEIDTYITKRVAMEFAMGSIDQLYSIAFNGTNQYITAGLEPQFGAQSIAGSPLLVINPSTVVNTTTDLFTLTHTLVNNDIVTYSTFTGNTVISGLANNKSYFVVQANGTVFGLSTTLGGSLVNLTAGVNETGHSLTRHHSECLPRILQDFTIEGWVYLNAHTATTPTIFSTQSAVTAAVGPGSLVFYAGNASLAGGSTTTWSVVINNDTIINGTSAITNQLWHHFAIVRSGSTITLYIDGVANGTATYAGPIISQDRTMWLGTNGATPSSSYLDGYIHRFRVVIGEAVYTSAFTARNLSPLSHFNNTMLHVGAQKTHVNSLNILDYGPFNNPITLYGANNVTVSSSQTTILLNTPANSSFLTDTSTNAYVATNVGAVSNTSSPFSSTGSAKFGGTGQYATYAISNTTMSVASSTPFTIEFWMYALDQLQAANAPAIFSTTNNGGTTGHMACFIGHTGFGNPNQIAVYWRSSPGLILSTAPYIKNAWTHVAIVRSGATTTTLYVNGVPNSSISYNGPVVFNGNIFYLGTSGDQLLTSSFTGNISNFRFVNGVAVYNGVFAPPGAPLQTSITANTSIPQISSVNPYNVGSISFNGSSQYLSAPSNSGFAFGTGDFTLEAWIYVAGGASNRTVLSTRPTSAGYTTAGSLGVDSGGGVYWYTNGYTAQNTSSQGLSSTWAHIAVVRNGSGSNNLQIYINGTSVITATDSTDYTAQVLSIGGNNDGSELFNGNITCVRVVTGTAAYTANFNRSVSVPSDITNTKLLMYVRNNTDWLVDDASGLTITATGSPTYSQTPFCPVSTKSNAGTLGVGRMDYGTSIGSWVDTWYPENSFFTAATNQTVPVYQDLTTAPAVGFSSRPLGWNSTLSGLQQMPDSDIDTRISSRVVSYMTASQGIGSYWLGAAYPIIGGVWVKRATFTNTLNPTIVNTAIEQASSTFNASTGVNANTEVITCTAAHRFSNDSIVTYTVPRGNNCILGLANGASYYIVNTISGSTTLQLAATIGGTPLDIGASIVSETHTLTLSANTFLWQKVSESPGSLRFNSSGGISFFSPSLGSNLGARPFTWECWLQWTQPPSNTWYIWVTPTNGTTNFPTITINNNLTRSTNLGAATPFSSIGNLPAGFDGKWHHLALVYNQSPNTCYFYYDGVLANSVVGTFTPAGPNTTICNVPASGGNGTTPALGGKITHLRITAGGAADALYLSTPFTPPTGPATPTANTRVLVSNLSQANIAVNSSPINLYSITFNALSGVNSATEYITTTSAHSLVNGDQVIYFLSTGNTVVTGLTANASYFVVGANSTALQLSLTPGGAAVNITAGAISETGHTLTRGTQIYANSAIGWSPVNPYTEAGIYGFTSNNIPVIYSPTGGPVKRALEDDIRTIVNQTRNYIVSSNIGKYALSATAPTPGTWVAVGPGIVDTKRKVGTYTPPRFTKEYTGAFTGNFTGGAGTGFYAGGIYTREYTGVVYAAEYTREYTGGPYTNTGYTGITTAKEAGVFTTQNTYTQAYTNANPVYNTYTAAYAAYTVVWTSPRLAYTLAAITTAVYTNAFTNAIYVRTYTRGGVFGTFTGIVYTATVAPVYNALYTRGLFTGLYTGIVYQQGFTKLYTLGAVVSGYTASITLPAIETIQTIKLWVRTA